MRTLLCGSQGFTEEVLQGPAGVWWRDGETEQENLRLRCVPGRERDETSEEVKAPTVKPLNAVTKLLDPVSYRQSGEHFKQRMIWKQEIHGKFMENKSFMDKIHQRVWIFLFYIFYFEYIGNVKGVETDSSQPPLNTAKYLSWKNNKHF